MSRGGYGLTRLLDRLDLTGLSPRPVIGFSDGTALHVALLQEAGLCGIHGPVLHSLADHADATSRERLRRLLAGEPIRPLAGRVLVEGAATGPAIGGNLCLLAALCGTRWQPRAEGAILVLEEIGEPAYRLLTGDHLEVGDRTLQQLRSAGVLDAVAGVAIGELTGCTVPEGASWDLDDLFGDQLAPLGVPVLAGLPVGHGPANHAWVHGARARLSGGELAWERGLV